MITKMTSMLRTMIRTLGDNSLLRPGRAVQDYLLLLVVWLIAGHVTCRAVDEQRFADQSFPAETEVLNQTITCGKHVPGKFVAPTFTCANLRVGGHRLAYGYYSGWAVGQEDQRCQETAGVHEFAHLCVMLLKSINMDGLGFKAAYIPKSTCAYLNETRKLLRKISADQYEWQDFKPGWGWTETIQCMTNFDIKK